jgi:hypothetical protein
VEVTNIAAVEATNIAAVEAGRSCSPLVVVVSLKVEILGSSRVLATIDLVGQSCFVAFHTGLGSEEAGRTRSLSHELDLGLAAAGAGRHCSP